jgi:AraC-like DNA-binding protein
MKVIGYITEENTKLYDVETIRKLAGTSRSKIHRELKKHLDGNYFRYKNQYLYSENILFKIIESILLEKLNNQNEL